MMKTKGIYVGSDRFDDKTKKEKREGGAHLSDKYQKNNDSILLAIILPPSPDSKNIQYFQKKKRTGRPRRQF
jgi:hypothetical protein